MRLLADLFKNNQKWAAEVVARDSTFFRQLSEVQRPRYMWIGCSDSRVPANEIVGLLPGEMFVHRNVANLAVHTDVNMLSVLQYAVEVLSVEHVIVCGHYGCGGIQTVVENRSLGLIDNWLRNVRDVYCKHRQELEALTDLTTRANRLCELNVREQVHNIGCTTIIQQAWKSGRKVAIHGWIYGLADGLLKDLNVCIDDAEQLDAAYRI